MEDINKDRSENATVEHHNLRRDNIIGESEGMTRVLELIAKVAMTDTTVLITGESGTGKELIAQAIHENSGRKDMPFIAVNCGSIPENLIESDLFGHEKGSFTGAIGQQIGKFERANGGTLFLDEIGEMSLSAQVKLLRVLQDQIIERVGGQKTVPIDIRVIAATNRDLEESIEERKFREDLFYRIDVVRIHLPPLRERKQDIPLLIEYFMKKFNKENRCSKSIQKEVIDTLMEYYWKGNIRHLENVIEYLITMSSTEVITIKDISPEALAANKHEQVANIISDNEIQLQRAKSYRALCDWILKERNWLDGDQIEAPLKNRAKSLGLWETKRGVAGIGRDLINILETHRKLFQDIDREGIKSIFDLLFALSPGFESEKSKAVGIILGKWSFDEAADASLPKPICSLEDKYDLIKGSEFRSNNFNPKTERIVIITKVWGMVGPPNTTVYLKRSINSFIEQNDDDLPPIDIVTTAETDQIIEQRTEVQINKAAIYYLMVHSTCNFDVKVYEVTW